MNDIESHLVPLNHFMSIILRPGKATRIVPVEDGNGDYVLPGPTETRASSEPHGEGSIGLRDRAIAYLEVTGIRAEQMTEREIAEAEDYLRGLENAEVRDAAPRTASELKQTGNGAALPAPKG